jgi:hypothetical protein
MIQLGMETKAEHKTNIIPLRWFANLCNHIGTPHLVRMFYMQDELNITSGFVWNYHSFMWRWTWSVYKKWGTTYLVVSWDLEEDIDKDDI